MIIYNNVIPFRGYKAINLFGVIFVRKEYKDKFNEVDLNHEKIHTAQMKEMLYVFFYIWYLIEWLIRLCINKRTAYKNIKFEKEAYLHLYELDYLSNRSYFNWIF